MKAVWLVLAAGLLAGCVSQPEAPKPTVAAPVLPEVKSADLRQGAEAGDAGAQVRLGKMLLDKGSYFEPMPEGVAWLEKAAGQGSVEARLILGYRYRAAFCGGPVQRLDKCHEARRWFEKAAETGDVEAMGALVSMLSRQPVQDLPGAYYWALLRQRQKAMPPSAWIEEATALKSALPQEQAGGVERWVALWRPAGQGVSPP